VTGLLAACGAGTTLTQSATVANVTNSAYVYALSGSAPELPAAYDMVTGSFVRPIVQSTGSVNFEIAFDIDSLGQALLLPVRSVAPLPPQPTTGSPSVGFRRATIGYDAITTAQQTGYVFDSVTTAKAGDAFYIELPSAGCVYGEPYYGKMSIDSINVVDRRLVVRAMTNRNCGGYRSLVDGLPKN
jgi:hypothetical protein